MPEYLTLFYGISGQCTTHLDKLSYVSHVKHNTTSINKLNKSFFIRNHSVWNVLPLEIRK